MPYSPPASPLNASWTGAAAYGGAARTILASWSTGSTQTVYQPPGAAPGDLGAVDVRARQFFAAPSGIASGGFGATFALGDFGYRPPQFTLSATWLGATVYAGAFSPISPPHSPATPTVSPPGLAPGAFGSPTVIKQQFIAASGFASDVFGLTQYVLHQYEYPTPQWIVNATWVAAAAYIAPTSPLNAAFTPPAGRSTIALTGWSSFSAGTPSTHNLLQLVGASGFSGASFGDAFTRLAYRRIDVLGGAFTAFGTARADLSIRYLGLTGIAPGALGTAQVTNAARAVAPVSINGEGYGRPTAWFAVRSLTVEGFDGSRIGTAMASYRDRGVSLLGFDTLRIGRPTVADPTPAPPPRQSVLPVGFSLSSQVPSPVVYPVKIYPNGFLAGAFGTARALVGTIAPESFFTNDEFQFGTPRVNTAQRIQPLAFPTDLEMVSQVPPPMLSPTTIRISEDIFGNFVWPPAAFPVQSDAPTLPSVTFRIRSLLASGDSHAEFGTPGLTLRNRIISATGIEAPAFNIPLVSGGNKFVAPYWGRDTEEWVEGGDYDTASYGTPSLAIRTPNLRPAGISQGGFGSADVSNFHRTVAPAGLYATAFTANHWVHPPVRLYPTPFVATRYGATMVSNRVRQLGVSGIAPPDFDPAIDLYVRSRGQISMSGIAPGDFAEPTLTLPHNGVVATLGDTSVFGRPRLGACAC